jgi:RimJ/RimL family protein N-acetyltransferase
MNDTLTVQPAGMSALEGCRLTLERMGPRHAGFLHALLAEPGFWDRYRSNQNCSQALPDIVSMLEEENRFLPQQLQKIEWVINRKDSAEPIGLAALAAYQPEHRRAELLVGIREPHARRWATGLEATLLVLDFAFNVIKLNKLTSLVYGYNAAAQQNTLRLGFRNEGFFEKHLWNPSLRQFVDVHQNAMLEQQFRGNAQLAALSIRLLGNDVTRLPSSVPFAALDSRNLQHATSQLLEQRLLFQPENPPQEKS